MTQLYLVPVDERWMPQFERTVVNPVDLTESPIEELQALDEARVWGTTTSERKRTFFEAMRSGDAILFYHDGEFFAKGRTGVMFENPQAGRWLWNNVESRFIYTVRDYQTASIPVRRVNELLGYAPKNVPNGFVRVSDSAINHLRGEYPSVDAAIRDLR